MFKYTACTHKGKGRGQNEDRVMVDNHLLSEGDLSGKINSSVLAVVCDGVGKEVGGAIAAEIATESFRELQLSKVSPLTVFGQLSKANKQIIRQQKCNSRNHRMATTAAGIILDNNCYIMFYVGDTRIYESTEEGLIIHTKDHVVNQDSKRNVLTKYIGGNGSRCIPTVKRGVIKNNKSLFLICSDGVYKNIPKKVMQEILSSNLSLEEKKEAILQHSLQDSSDDCSIILLSA